MGKINTHQIELANKHFASVISFDAIYHFAEGKISGNETNVLSLNGNQNVCLHFGDTTPFSYVINIEKCSAISLYACFCDNCNSEIHINCHENVTCEHIILQEENSVQKIYVGQKKASSYIGKFFQLNGQKAAINLTVFQENECATTHLSGIFFPKNNETYSIYTKVCHQKPNGTTQELFRGIADDNGSGTFSGIIYVAPNAQKTEAHQQNKNILLSPLAHIHSEPQLEIYADDVICNHGSSTGQIDEEALWYMQARGINKEDAIKLLVNGFANDVLDMISNKDFRNFIEKKIAEKLRDKS